MERNFMGLAVKQEISEETIDAAPLRSAAMQWPMSNKARPHPQQQFLSFHGSHEDKPKTGFDSLASTGLVTITTTRIDSDHKSYSGLMQKTIVPENQGVRYTLKSYPTTNMTVSPAIGGVASIHSPFAATSAPHMAAPLSPQPISAIPMVNPMPYSSPVVGTTDLRNGSKISGAPAQLTIFYNGSVCVYDNVSADKAQAIMLLAGNAAAPAPPAPAQASMARPSILESFSVSHPYGASTHRLSPASPSVGWSGASKQGSILVSNSNRVEPMKVVSSSSGSGSASATFTSSNAVPQFRRKSLARFLEKRKERVINAGPYADKESPDCNSLSSCPVTAVN